MNVFSPLAKRGICVLAVALVAIDCLRDENDDSHHGRQQRSIEIGQVGQAVGSNKGLVPRRHSARKGARSLEHTAESKGSAAKPSPHFAKALHWTRWRINFAVCMGALVLWAIFLICKATRSTGLSLGRALGLNNIFQVAIFIGYIACSCAHMFLQSKAGATGYSIISATILVYLGKSVVSFAMFLARAESTDWASNKLERLKSCAMLTITGGFLAGYDALSFLSLRNLDPATYRILVHMRVIFVILFWQWMFQKKISTPQWQALLVLIAGGVTKAVGRADVMEAGIFAASLWLMVAQNGLAAVASVFAETLLKKQAMPTDLVNTIIYSFGLIWLLIVLGFSQGRAALYDELLAPEAWAKLAADPWMIGSIACLIVFGIITAYLLRELSNIVKEISGGIVIIFSTMLEWALVGSSVMSVLNVLGMCLAVLSIGVYSIHSQKILGDTLLEKQLPTAVQDSRIDADSKLAMQFNGESNNEG